MADLNVGRLRAFLTLDAKRFTTQLKAAEKRLKQTSDTLGRLGRSLSLRVTAPLALVGGTAIKTAASFEKSMNRVRALSGSAGQQFEDLRDQAKDLGITTQFSAAQAAEGMAFLAKAGFDTNKILGATPDTLLLAAAAGLDLATSADVVTNIMAGFRIESDELTNSVDILTKAFTTSNTDLLQLAQAMKFVGPVAQGLNQDFADMVSIVGSLGNVGIQASLAGTSLRGALTKLVNPVGKNATLLARLAGNVKDAEGGLIPLTEIIGRLEKSGTTTAQVMQLFGLRAGPAMAALIGIGQEALEKFGSRLVGVEGTAEAIAKIQLEGFFGQLTKLGSALAGLSIEVLDTGILKAFTKVLEKITQFVRTASGATRAMLLFGAAAFGVATSLGPLLIGIGLAGLGLSKLGGAFLLLNKIIKASVLFKFAKVLSLVGIAVGAVIVAFEALARVVGATSADLSKAFQDIPGFGPALARAFSEAKQIFIRFAQLVFNIFQNTLLLAEKFGQLVFTGLKQDADRVFRFIESKLPPLANLLEGLSDLVVIGPSFDKASKAVTEFRGVLQSLLSEELVVIPEPQLRFQGFAAKLQAALEAEQSRLKTLNIDVEDTELQAALKNGEEGLKKFADLVKTLGPQAFAQLTEEAQQAGVEMGKVMNQLALDLEAVPLTEAAGRALELRAVLEGIGREGGIDPAAIESFVQSALALQALGDQATTIKDVDTQIRALEQSVSDLDLKPFTAQTEAMVREMRRLLTELDVAPATIDAFEARMRKARASLEADAKAIKVNVGDKIAGAMNEMFRGLLRGTADGIDAMEAFRNLFLAVIEDMFAQMIRKKITAEIKFEQNIFSFGKKIALKLGEIVGLIDPKPATAAATSAVGTVTAGVIRDQTKTGNLPTPGSAGAAATASQPSVDFSFLTDIADTLKDNLSAFVRGIGKFILKVPQLLSQGVGALVSGIKSIVSALSNINLGGIGGGGLGGIAQAAIGIGSLFIPFLAEGALVTKPTLAMIGEKGPELVIPQDKLADFGLPPKQAAGAPGVSGLPSVGFGGAGAGGVPTRGVGQRGPGGLGGAAGVAGAPGGAGLPDTAGVTSPPGLAGRGGVGVGGIGGQAGPAGAAGLPGLATLPELTPAPDLPLAGIPGAPGAPGTSTLGGFAEAIAMPGLPGTAGQPGAAGRAGEAGAAGSGGLAEATALPALPGLPGAAGVGGAGGKPGPPGGSALAKATALPGLPGLPGEAIDISSGSPTVLADVADQLSLPKLAEGGIVRRPTLALIGESEPEVVTPLSRMPQAGSANVTVQVFNSTGEPAEVQETRGPDGGRLIKVLVGRIVREDLATGGPISRSITDTFGGSRKGIRR